MSQFNTLSKDFREALLKMAGDGKEERIASILHMATSVMDRMNKDWLLSMDNEGLLKVEGFFTRLHETPTTDLINAMAEKKSCCPFDLVADMFSNETDGGIEVVEEAEEDEDDGQDYSDAEVVEDEGKEPSDSQ